MNTCELVSRQIFVRNEFRIMLENATKYKAKMCSNVTTEMWQLNSRNETFNDVCTRELQ